MLLAQHLEVNPHELAIWPILKRGLNAVVEVKTIYKEPYFHGKKNPRALTRGGPQGPALVWNTCGCV